MLRADFLAVELSDSFQNLAHRLQAMRHFKQHSRRQWFFITCAIALLGTVAVVPWRVVAQEAKEAQKGEAKEAGVLLADAVAEFNRSALEDQIGKMQPPLSEDEVIKAIGSWDREATPASDEVLATYQTIARTKRLPADAHLKFNTRWTINNEDFAVWWVDLTIKTGPETGYGYRIRAKGLGVDDEPVPIKVAAPTEWGDLKGRFIYDGDASVPAPIQVQNDAQVFGKLNLVDQSLVVGKDDSLANVVVWVRQNNVPIHPSYDALKEIEATIQSSRGQFVPRVVPCWVGQPLEMRNLDDVAENIKMDFQTNEPRNYLLKSKGSIQRRALTSAEPSPVKISSSLHPWMMGWMVAKPHPYVAVSDRDGTFTIKNLPAGVALEFQVWQERAGQVQKASIGGKDAGWTKGRFTMTLEAGENNLGEIKLAAGQFNEQELTQAAAEPAAPKAAPKVDTPVNVDAPTTAAEKTTKPDTSERRASPTRRAGEAREAETRRKLELLIGTWRGGHSNGEITFREGGIFEESEHSLIRPNARFTDAGIDSVQGKWSVRASRGGEGSIGWIELNLDATGASLRGLPIRSNATGAVASAPRFLIRRLDESLLRVSDSHDSHRVLFFHRVDEQANRPKYDAALPEDIRRLAEIMELSADEAQAFADAKFDWMKEWKVSEPQVKLLERVAAARRGKIDLAELFELTKDEAGAYAEIYGMTEGDFTAIQALNRDSQLSAAEQAAIKKLVAARKEFNEIEIAVGAGANQAQSNAKGEKLKAAFAGTQKNLTNLRLFLDATAFAKPQPQGPYPVTPYPDTSKKPLPGAGRFELE